jgi:hypothetical protein
MSLRIVLVAAVAAAFAGSAAAQSARPLSAHMMGSNEKPTAGDPDGMGHTTVKVDTAKNQVCWDMMVENIAAPTMAHIHKGAPDAAGGVVVPLTPPDASGKSSGCATVDAALAKDLLDNPGNYYVNVHNAEFRAGALRGQLGK